MPGKRRSPKLKVGKRSPLADGRLIVLVVAVVVVVGVATVALSLGANRYFCDGNGGSGQCIQMLDSGNAVKLVAHANASPALHESFQGGFGMCGNDHVSRNCPFVVNSGYNHAYLGSNIDDIRLTNYNDQCLGVIASDSPPVVVGAPCGADYTAWVKGNIDGKFVFINVRYTNEHLGTLGLPWVLSVAGGPMFGNTLVLKRYNISNDQFWDNHLY